MRSRRVRYRRQPDPIERDAGFTLIELLVVLVILPMIVGAVAIAIIGTYKNEAPTASRLSDSVNAQLASAYFVRDVQGASLLTTDSTVAAPFTLTNPQPCGSGATLLVSMFRLTGSTADVVSYWTTTSSPTEIVRLYCNATITTYPSMATSPPTSTVVISNDVPTNQGPVLVTPANFAGAAQGGWVPISVNATAFANATTALPISGASLALQAPPSGFVVNAAGGTGTPLEVATTTGTQTITCTGIASSSLTGCSGGAAGSSIAAGSQISQTASVAGVTLTTNESQSQYNVNLLSNPRTAPGAAGGCGAGCGEGPSLLTLGSAGATLNIHGNATVNVTGSVALDNGSLTCGGTDQFSASGSIETVNGGSTSTIHGGCVVSPSTSSWGTGTVGDPYGPYLPPSPPDTAFPEPPPSMRYDNPQYHSAITLNPGEYLNQMTLLSGASVTLNPGVYVLDHGISVTGGASLHVASDFAGDGVLLYVPCDATDTWAPSCSGSVSITAGNVSILPLTAAQSNQYFGPDGTYGSLQYPGAEAGLWLWQNIGDSAAAALGGNSGTYTLSGTAYLPGASVTLDGTGSLTLGRVIAQSVTFTGTSATTVTGQ